MLTGVVKKRGSGPNLLQHAKRRFPAGDAVMLIEPAAAFHQFAKRNRPRHMTVRQQRCPGTKRAAIALHKAQRTGNRNHFALDLD
jgi:hypothetical protein